MIQTQRLSLRVLLPRLAAKKGDIIVHYGANAIDLFFCIFVLTAKRWNRFLEIIVCRNSTGVHTEIFENTDTITRRYSKSFQDGMIISFGTFDSCILCLY